MPRRGEVEEGKQLHLCTLKGAVVRVIWRGHLPRGWREHSSGCPSLLHARNLAKGGVNGAVKTWIRRFEKTVSCNPVLTCELPLHHHRVEVEVGRLVPARDSQRVHSAFTAHSQLLPLSCGGVEVGRRVPAPAAFGSETRCV